MKIGDREVDQIVVTDSEEEVVAVVSDSEIIEKVGYSVLIDGLDGPENPDSKTG